MPMVVKNGNTLVATINDTQILQAASLNAIAVAAQPAVNAFFTLAGTAGSAAAIAALANPGANTAYTIVGGSPYTMTNPAQVTLTSTVNNSGVNFAIVGIDATGALISETLAGPNNNTVYSVNVYKYVLQVVPSASQTTPYTSVGYSTVCGSTLFPASSKIILTSPGAAGGSVLITGTGSNGKVSSETLAGPTGAASPATSVNTYTSITSIKVATSLSANIAIGTPEILSGVSVQAMCGDF